ncbi:hypothetical protein ACTXT7_017209 [Hymenolepis weldensis]
MEVIALLVVSESSKTSDTLEFESVTVRSVTPLIDPKMAHDVDILICKVVCLGYGLLLENSPASNRSRELKPSALLEATGTLKGREPSLRLPIFSMPGRDDGDIEASVDLEIKRLGLRYTSPPYRTIALSRLSYPYPVFPVLLH